MSAFFVPNPLSVVCYNHDTERLIRKFLLLHDEYQIFSDEMKMK